MSQERLVVINPASASGRTAKRWHLVVDELVARGMHVEPALTRGPGDATRMVREFIEAGGREIVVLGGDGTVDEVAGGCLREDGSALVADGVTLSVIHQGTGGDFARGLGIPKDQAGAVRTAARGTAVPVDVGVATFADADGQIVTRGWISCCNVGMGADVVQRVTGRLKRIGDTAGFAAGTVVTFLKNGPRAVVLSLDGGSPRAMDIVDVIVANNRYMGGGMLVAPEAVVDDGLLDVVTIAAAGRLTLLRTFPRIYKGTHVDHPLVTIERARAVTIDAPEAPQGVVLDGELVGTTPATFRLISPGIRVRVPSTG